MQSTSDADAELGAALKIAIVTLEGCFELIAPMTGNPTIVPDRLQVTV